MNKVEVTNYFDTGLSPGFANLRWLELEDVPLGEGAFGAVYDVRRTNTGPAKTSFVAKTFKTGSGNNPIRGFNTVQTLQQKIMNIDQGMKTAGTKGISSFSFFDGFPLLSFQGRINKGNTIFGYITKRLDTGGYCDFDSILENTNMTSQLLQLPLQQKFALAIQLVEGMRLLKRVGFVHADINPPNVFINIQHAKISLIDFDSGAVMTNPNDKPTTWGKPGDWVAPEIMEELSVTQNSVVRVNLHTDTWSVAVAIHYLFFGCHPLFFLANLGSKTVRAYLSHYKWPEINEADIIFNKSNANAYKSYRHVLSQMPPKVVEKMAATINLGFSNPALRTSYESWELALRGAEEPPRIDDFKCNHIAAYETTPVTFEWKATGAARLLIETPDGKTIDVTQLNSHVALPIEGIYRLHAQGHFGSDEKMVPMRVWRHPRIQMVTIPSPSIRVHRFSIPSISIQARDHLTPQVVALHAPIQVFALPLGFTKRSVSIDIRPIDSLINKFEDRVEVILEDARRSCKIMIVNLKKYLKKGKTNGNIF